MVGLSLPLGKGAALGGFLNKRSQFRATIVKTASGSRFCDFSRIYAKIVILFYATILCYKLMLLNRNTKS
jgi:hypothetical protein